MTAGRTLAVDIGNTNTVLGLFEDGGVVGEPRWQVGEHVRRIRPSATFLPT